MELPRLKAGQPFRLLTDYSVKGALGRHAAQLAFMALGFFIWIPLEWMVNTEEWTVPHKSYQHLAIGQFA